MASYFDVEDEGIISAIFKESFPESWRDNPDFAHYLSELSSYGVDKLAREPERLAEEKSQILEQTQDLAFHNYKTFIETADCSREIYQDFQIIEQHVGGMLEKLPNLTSSCNEFMKKAQEISVSRKMNSLTLQRHTQLLEILEMPQLMDTCVRNGYYEEALELASHVKRLEKKHSNIPVIVNIVNEVKNSMQLMLNQLIQQLRSNIQLPACLRVIGYLRRMDVFTEAELRIKFLQARDAWLQSLLNAIPTEDPYHHITKVVETSRVHLFDIVTQYRAIFSDEDPLLSTSKDDAPNEGALFHGWVVQKVSQFLQTLEVDLQRGVGGRLDSVLGQCMYFGLSFSRVGADFRGLLAPVFQQAALDGLRYNVAIATKRFEESMQTYSLLSIPPMFSSSTYSMSVQTGQLAPPMVLLEHQPLALYCNNILTAFNDLRLCAPLSLASEVALCIQQSLEKVISIILAFHRAEEGAFNQKEQENFTNFCDALASELLPYLNKCLQSLFPPMQLAQTLGLTVQDLAKLGNIGSLDIKTILEPIKHLIPVKEEITVAPIGQTLPTADDTTSPSGENLTVEQSAESSISTEEAVESEASDEKNIEKTPPQLKINDPEFVNETESSLPLGDLQTSLKDMVLQAGQIETKTDEIHSQPTGLHVTMPSLDSQLDTSSQKKSVSFDLSPDLDYDFKGFTALQGQSKPEKDSSKND